MHKGTDESPQQEGHRSHSREGTINNMTALHQPIVAQTRNGELVRIVALGDVEGFSPACWLINERGEIDLAGTDRFTVVDASALPPSSQAIRQLTNRTQQFGSSKY